MMPETSKLKDLCEVKTGVPTGRAKKLSEGEQGHQVNILLPKAMSEGAIIDEELGPEVIGAVKDDYFTREGDVVIKLSTPYDSVYIDKEHEGLLITSFAMLLRKKDNVELNMRYLSMFLNAEHTNEILQSTIASQSVVRLLRKHDVEDLEIALLPLQQQKLLADLFEAITERRQNYERLIELDRELLSSQLMQAIWGDE